jgi:hypothetical protein
MHSSILQHCALFVSAIDALQMSHLCHIDASIVRVLGKDFSILGTRLKSVTEAFMKQICGSVREAHGGTPSSPVLKIHHDDKLASALSSSSAIVLSINFVSVLLARLLSCDAPIDSSRVEFVEFLLRFLEIGSISGISHASTAKSHTFVSNQCMICTRCTF